MGLTVKRKKKLSIRRENDKKIIIITVSRGKIQKGFEEKRRPHREVKKKGKKKENKQRIKVENR